MATPYPPSPDTEPPAAEWGDPGPIQNAWSPSQLRRVLRSRTLYWSVAAILAVGAGVSAHRLTADARAVLDELGRTRSVLVATAPVEAGDAIEAELVEVPVRVVPEGALTGATGVPAGRPIAPGAVITSLDLLAPTELGIDEAAIAVPTTPTTPPVNPGDDVVIVVGADPYAGTVPDLIPARVVDLADGQLVLALTEDRLLAAAAALQSGAVTVALAG